MTNITIECGTYTFYSIFGKQTRLSVILLKITNSEHQFVFGICVIIFVKIAISLNNQTIFQHYYCIILSFYSININSSSNSDISI